MKFEEFSKLKADSKVNTVDKQTIKEMIDIGVRALNERMGSNCDVGYSYTILRLSKEEVRGISTIIANALYNEGYKACVEQE